MLRKYKFWLKKYIGLFKILLLQVGLYRRSKLYDLVFISPESGWILDRICKEIDRYFQGETAFFYSIEDLPFSKTYFFSHYSLLSPSILKNPHILNSQLLVYHTHPRDVGQSDEELVSLLNKATKVFTMNQANRLLLCSKGLKEGKVMVLPGGVDPKIFCPEEVSGGKVSSFDRLSCVGFCLAFRDSKHYRERKNYNFIIDLIQNLQDHKILLLGRGWLHYERFGEIASLPNFQYVEIDYLQYPDVYRQMDIFVSASKLEGGPIPLIEAMMCNVFPVVSNTGFAPDMITHGHNGLLFDVNASVEIVCDLIKQAWKLKPNVDVRETVEHLTWENFSLAVQSVIDSN